MKLDLPLQNWSRPHMTEPASVVSLRFALGSNFRAAVNTADDLRNIFQRAESNGVTIP